MYQVNGAESPLEIIVYGLVYENDESVYNSELSWDFKSLNPSKPRPIQRLERR